MNNSSSIKSRLDSEFVVAETWPKQKKLTLREALKEFHKDEEWKEIEKNLKQLEAHEKMAETPIVAVVGSLNGGKSSCVSAFLSEKGRQRVLRGVNNEQGTHRFVFWLPEAWRESNIRKTFEDLLVATFGSKPVDLADNPKDAHCQYNEFKSTETMRSPLIAFDEGLENFCLLDCLDVESKIAEQTAQDRLECLRQAVGLMHGLIFLIDAAQARAEVLTKLSEVFESAKKRNVEQFLLVNKVLASNGDLTRLGAQVAEIRKAIEPCRLFAAYNFDSKSNHEANVLPKAAAQAVGLPDEMDLPCFFNVDEEDEAKNRGDGVAEERLLLRHLQRIDPKKLCDDGLERNRSDLLRHIAKSQNDVRREAERQQRDVEARHKGLVDFIFEYAVEGDEIKIPFTAEVMKRIMKSLEQTAPWYVKPGVKTALLLTGVKDAVSNGIKKVENFMKVFNNTKVKAADASKKKKSAVEKIWDGESEQSKIADKLSEKGISPERIARASAISKQMAGVEDISEDDCLAAWEKVFQARHSQDEFTADMRRDLDEATGNIWRQISVGQKVFIGTVVPLLGMVTAALALVDAGTSVVIFTTNIPTLLTLAVGGVGISARAWQTVDKTLKQHIALPSLCRMIARACDVFGLPRNLNGRQIKRKFASLGEVLLDAPADMAPASEKDIVVRLTKSKCYKIPNLEAQENS